MSETFAASLIVALVSLFGVLRTMRLSQKLHDENLAAERKKIREEREFSAKQAALMRASQAIIKMTNYFVTLPDQEKISGNANSPELELGLALNGLHFYCDYQTIEHTAKLGQKLNEAFIEAITVKLTAMFIDSDIQTLNMRIEGHKEMNKSSQAEILALEQGDPTNPLIGVHRGLIVNNFNAISDLHSQASTLIKAKYFATEKCRDIVKNHLKTIYNASSEVLLLARKELHFPIDESQYRTLIANNSDAAIKSIETAYAEIRAKAESKLLKETPKPKVTE